MAIPARLSKKLRQSLGDDTGGDLVTWLDEMRAEHEERMSRIEAMEARLVQRMDDRFAKVDHEIAGLQVAIADSKAELMKWMLLFWTGAVGAIAVLAGVLRQ
jgi:hypothetical protein